MVIDLLVIGFIVLSLSQFTLGIQIIQNNPWYLLSSLVSIVLLYLLTLLPQSKFMDMKIIPGSFLGKIKSNRQLKIIVALALLLISLGNFAYAYGSGVINHRLNYLEAVILALVAFLLLRKK